jgi:hypothetical protein
MSTSPKYPWRFDTNERYREVVRLIIGLSSAALLLPVFFAREFLAIEGTKPLKDIFSCSLYWSWGLLGLAIFSGILFHFLSAKWVRLAWGQSVGVFGCDVTDTFIENALHFTFWLNSLSFMVGLALIINFFVNYGTST